MVRWCACTSAYRVVAHQNAALPKPPSTDTWVAAAQVACRPFPVAVPAEVLRGLARDPVALDHLVMRSLLPGPEDWDAVRLPEWPEWLYWPLRPARLLAKYARAAVRERRRFPHVRHT